MFFRLYHPRGPLADDVAMIWYFAGVEESHARERVLPTGTTELVINLHETTTRVFDDAGRENRFRGGSVSGPQSRWFAIDSAQKTELLGVHFKPGGAYSFFGMPVDELRDRHAGLDDLWGGVAAELRERLLGASVDEKLRLMEHYLLARRRGARHGAVGEALRALSEDPTTPIGSLAERIGLSQRRFIQLFTREAGLTPKVFARVRRFQKVVSQVGSAPLLDLALDCGYYDQPHFVHDFRALAGLSPGDFLTRYNPAQPNHVPL